MAGIRQHWSVNDRVHRSDTDKHATAKRKAAQEIKALLAKKALLAESAAHDARKLDMEIAELRKVN